MRIGQRFYLPGSLEYANDAGRSISILRGVNLALELALRPRQRLVYAEPLSIVIAKLFLKYPAEIERVLGKESSDKLRSQDIAHDYAEQTRSQAEYQRMG